ncbi:malectin domain-containing carbohydrate-binding protein, partial [Aurantibacter sp.]|uniref:malectin domain-containing carbohydrate-binding protein n=1 Tax=Aurantibacter sp. TaxID=2807103 RepID=UPI003266DCAD
MISLFEVEKKAPYFKNQILPFKLLLAVLLSSWTSATILAQENSYAVMEVVEVEFETQLQYDNAYLEVDVWIELRKSESVNEVYRIPIFWDGDNVFRGRLVATSPGNWSWNIINATVENSDPAFIDKKGSFTAFEADVTANANNHGFIRVAENNRTLEYADGTPYFYTADTSWSALTEVFDYSTANNITGISFQEYILARKNQGFNGLNVIASFPDDTYIADYNKNKQFPNRTRGLWSDNTWGKKVGPNGATPFEMKAPNAEITDWSEEVDYRKINPEYWKSVDQRMQFLADEGFVTLFESVRRHERWPFRTDASEKDAFYNYIRYLWARYGCYNMIFSWVHLDSDAKVYKPWRSLVEYAYDKLSVQLGNQMPYGQPRTAMSFDTSLTNWGNPNEAESQSYPGLSKTMDVQNVSNAGRDEIMHEWLSDLYDDIEQPALNLEPFYPGWVSSSDFNPITEGLDDTTMAQMQMYGSVLSGGFAGHAWGDAWYAGAVENWGTKTDRMVAYNDPQVNAIEAYESQSMGHLKNFMLDTGHEYTRLIPAADTHLSDSQKFVHSLAISDDEEFALGFFAGVSRSNPSVLPTITNLSAAKTYLFEWWNVTTGEWISAGKIETNNDGVLQPPTLPNNEREKNWAYRIRSEAYLGEEIEDEVVDEPINNFALRINAGGNEFQKDGNIFSADTSYNTGNTLNRPQTNLEAPYKSFRYSRSQELSYEISLEDGEYTVLLHFAELWFGATGGGNGGEGLRVFDVTIEDNLVEDNLDVFAEVGAETLLTKTYTVNVTDGQLDIDFSSLASDGGNRHPIINAIEILASETVDIPEEEEEEEE